MLRTAVVACLAFALGALAYRAELHYAWLATFGLKSGFEKEYAAAVVARQPVPCRQGESTALLLIMGQSNAANTVQGPPYRPRHRSINFNALDGRCYLAEEPLLGMYRYGQPWNRAVGSIWTRVADALIDAGSGDVILAPIAQVGSGVAEWAGGEAGDRLTAALASLNAAHLRPTAVLWHQGETDAEAGMPADEYERHFSAVLGRLRAAGVTAPVYVARATVCRNFGSEEIRRAQMAVTRLPGVRAGPDTDALDRVGSRHDGCHFSADGGRQHALLWLEALTSE